MANSLRTIARLTYQAVVETVRGGALLEAQAVAFNMFIAFFPALLFLAGVLVYIEPGLEDLLEGLRVVLPPGSRLVVVNSLLKLSEHPGRLLLVGGVGTIVLGAALMFSLERIFAGIHGVEGHHSFWERQALSIGMVIITVIPWMTASVLVVFSKFVRVWLIEMLGVGYGPAVRLLWSIGYFALAILTAVLVLAALYYFLGPGGERWEDVLPGAAVALIFWWIVTTSFAFYVRHLAIYNVIYGGFAAAIGLLVWMYLTAVVILIGAHFNAKLEALRARAPA